MLCEDCQPLLLEYADGTLRPEQRTEISAHVDSCDDCSAALREIHEASARLSEFAASWQEQTPPPWTPPLVGRGERNQFLDNFRLWFPTFASALALVMVTVLFVQQPVDNGALPGTTAAADYSELPPLPQATQAAMVQSVLEDSRDERGQEIQALLKILKAEMDKRSIETEESLRYIISHQIKGQQELDELYAQVEALMGEEPQTIERPREVSP